MSNKSEAVKKWRQKTKERIVKSLGSKCVCCESESFHTFDIHHLDPMKKEFGFGDIRANPKNWLSIVEELRKCILVCANCHREIHANVRKIPDNPLRFNEGYLDYKEVRPKSICPICGKEKFKYNKTCSLECGGKVRYHILWNEKELIQMIDVEHKPFTKIGELLGCSDNAVRKRYLKIKLLESRLTGQPNDC